MTKRSRFLRGKGRLPKQAAVVSIALMFILSALVFPAYEAKAANVTIGNEQFTAVIGDLGQIRELRMKNNSTTNPHNTNSLDTDPNFMMGNVSSRESSTAHQWTGELIFATRAAETRQGLAETSFREQDTNKTLAYGGSTTTNNIAASNPRFSRTDTNTGADGRGKTEIKFIGLDDSPSSGPAQSFTSNNGSRIMRGYDVVSTFDMNTDDGSFLWTIQVTNKSDEWIEFGDIGMPMSWNTQYNGNTQDTNYTQRVVANAYAGIDSGYAHIKRASGQGNSLIFAPVPESGARIEYVDQWFRNYQNITGERQNAMFYDWAHDSSNWSTGIAVYYIHSKAIRRTGAGYHMENSSLILAPGETGPAYQLKFLPVRDGDNEPGTATAGADINNPINDNESRSIETETNLRTNLYENGMLNAVAVPSFQTAINMPAKLNLHYDKDIVRLRGNPRILCVHQEECEFDYSNLPGFEPMTMTSGNGVQNVANYLESMNGHVHGRDCDFNDPYDGTHIPVLTNGTAATSATNFRSTEFKQRGYRGIHNYYDGTDGKPLYTKKVALNVDKSADGFFLNDRNEWNQVWDLNFACIGNNSVRVDYELYVGPKDEQGKPTAPEVESNWVSKFTQYEFNVLTELDQATIVRADWLNRNQTKTGTRAGAYLDSDIHVGPRTTHTSWGDDWSHPHFPMMGAKNLLIPNVEEIRGIEAYADWAANTDNGGRGGLVQNSYRVYNWIGQTGSRAFSELTCGMGFFEMYKIQKAYPDLMEYKRHRNWYLEIARGIARNSGMSSVSSGKYGEQEIVEIYEALMEEGFSQALITDFRDNLMRARGRYMADTRHPFISEFPFDNTGEEAAYAFAQSYLKYIGKDVADGGFTSAETASRQELAKKKLTLVDLTTRAKRSLSPSWFNYGVTTFLGGESWWNFQYTTGFAGSVMDDYLRYQSEIHNYTSDQRAWANRVAYSAKIAHFNSINMGQIAGPRPGTATRDIDNYGALGFRYTMAKGGRGDQNSYGYDGTAGNGFANNANFNGWYSFSGEASQGVFASLLRISTDVVTDPVFGLFAYGGKAEKANNILTVEPLDGFGKRLNFIDEGIYVNLTSDKLGTARLTSDISRLELDIEHLDAAEHWSRIVFNSDGSMGGLTDGYYKITVPGAEQPIGQFKVDNGSGIAWVRLPAKSLGSVTTVTLEASMGENKAPVVRVVQTIPEDSRNIYTGKVLRARPFTLESFVYDDNYSNTRKTVAWSVISMPEDATESSVEFSDASSLYTTVSASVAGDYTIRASVTDASGVTGTSDINITVDPIDIIVEKVTVSPSAVSVPKTGSQAFTAQVTGQYVELSENETVWSLVSAEGKAAGTVLSENGLLTVAANETLESLTVRATSGDDPSKFDDATVTVTTPAVTGVAVTQPMTAAKGKYMLLDGSVSGENLTAATRALTWSIVEAEGKAAGTSLSPSGVLVVDADETLETLTVMATSRINGALSGTGVVTITDAAPIQFDRSAFHTFAEGNVARDPALGTGTGRYAGQLYNATADTPKSIGITANYANTTNGADDTQIIRMIDGTGSIAAGSGANTGWNTWGGGASGQNPEYAVINWPQKYIIDATRMIFWHDGNGSTSGVQIPDATNGATLEWWDGTAWKPVTNMKRPNGDDTANIVNPGDMANAQRPNWNAVTFDAVETDRLRLRLIKRQTSGTNGIGISEWEVFGAEGVPSEYSVTYELNGGGGTAPVNTYNLVNAVFAAGDIAGAPSGMIFKEWNTAADGSGTSYPAGAVITMPANDLTLYAIWEVAGNAITTFEMSADKVVSVTVVALRPENAVLRLAAYNESGALIAASSYELDPDGGQKQDILTGFDCAGTAGIRAFLWDKNFVPLCDAKIIK